MSSLLISSLCSSEGGSAAGGTTYGDVTLAEMILIPANPGETAFCTDYNFIFQHDGFTWQIPGYTYRLLNNSGGDLAVENYVVFDVTADRSFTIQAVFENKLGAGVLILPSTAGQWSTVAYRGIWWALKTGGSINRGDFLTTSSATAGCVALRGGTWHGCAGIAMANPVVDRVLMNVKATEYY